MGSTWINQPCAIGCVLRPQCSQRRRCDRFVRSKIKTSPSKEICGCEESRPSWHQRYPLKLERAWLTLKKDTFCKFKGFPTINKEILCLQAQWCSLNSYMSNANTYRRLFLFVADTKIICPSNLFGRVAFLTPLLRLASYLDGVFDAITIIS